jgi:hypothetical protein
MIYFKVLASICLDGLIEKTKLHLRQSISIKIRTGYLPRISHKLCCWSQLAWCVVMF